MPKPRKSKSMLDSPKNDANNASDAMPGGDMNGAGATAAASSTASGGMPSGAMDQAAGATMPGAATYHGVTPDAMSGGAGGLAGMPAGGSNGEPGGDEELVDWERPVLDAEGGDSTDTDTDSGAAGAADDAVLERLILATAEKDYVPTAADVRRSGKLRNVEATEEYLKRFGYLQSENLQEFGPLVASAAESLPEPTGTDDEPLHEGLRRFQAFNDLPVTGELDEATLEVMSLPRCGFPDLRPEDASIDAFTVQGSKWNTTALTYGFQNFTAELTQPQIRTAIQQALNMWAAVTPLTFTEIAFGSNPDIVIRFVSGNHGDGNAFDGPSGVLAHAYYPPPGGGAFAGDTHFDDAETWTVNLPPSGTDLVTVAAHEFGHALGLAHSTVSGALMAPYYTGAHRNLEADDIAGIQAIYGTKGGWASLGGVITSRIAVGRNQDGRLEIFARGTDNALWHRWQTAPNNGWSGWASLGGIITSDPTVVSNQDGRLAVFARGTDNAVWQRTQTAPNNGWGAWSSLGGVITSNVAAGRHANGRCVLFVRGSDGAVWHRSQSAANGSWAGGWSSLGGVITSEIAVANGANGSLYIFARGSDNAVWHRRQTAPNGVWAGWASLGGGITSNIAAGRNADGRLDIFARGTDNALWHRWQTAPNGAWGAWSSLGGIITSDPNVINNADGRLEAFARGSDNAVWHRWQTAPNGAWAGWASLGGIISGGVASGRNLDGRLELFVKGTDSAVWHRWQTAANNGWS